MEQGNLISQKPGLDRKQLHPLKQAALNAGSPIIKTEGNAGAEWVHEGTKRNTEEAKEGEGSRNRGRRSSQRNAEKTREPRVLKVAICCPTPGPFDMPDGWKECLLGRRGVGTEVKQVFV